MAIESREDLNQYVDLIENMIKNNGVGSVIGVYAEADWDNEYEDEDEDELYYVYLDGNVNFYGFLLIEEVPYDDIGWVCITLQTEIDKLNEKYK